MRNRTGTGRHPVVIWHAAAPGAIERIEIDPDTKEVNYKVIGRDAWRKFSEPKDMKAKGICGSGSIRKTVSRSLYWPGQKNPVSTRTLSSPRRMCVRFSLPKARCMPDVN